MQTQKDTIKCESIFNDDKTHRLYWKRVWNKDLPLCTVITLNPALADNIVIDTTTSLVVNNVAKLERFGGVICVNLFTLITPKLQMRWSSDLELNDYENDSYILKAAKEADTIVLAWGRGAQNNIRISNRANQVIELLAEHQDKLKVISDSEKVAIHPLTPSCRQGWTLVDYTPDILEE